MSVQAKTMITVLLLGNAVLVIELLRTRRLTESYTLLWLFVITCTLGATWADGFLRRLGWFFDAAAPISALTLLGLAFILVMLIFFSMKISRLTRDLKEMAQEVALRMPPPDTNSEGNSPSRERD